MVCQNRNWGFIIDLWQDYPTNFESDFFAGSLIFPLQRLFSLKDSRSSFSSRNHGVYARDQWSKRKEFGMEENEDGFVFASRIVTNAPIEPKFHLELRNTPMNIIL